MTATPEEAEGPRDLTRIENSFSVVGGVFMGLLGMSGGSAVGVEIAEWVFEDLDIETVTESLEEQSEESADAQEAGWPEAGFLAIVFGAAAIGAYIGWKIGRSTFQPIDVGTVPISRSNEKDSH